MTPPTYFSGRVQTLIFENEAQGFYILRMILDGYTEAVTVRGNVLGINVEVGTWFGFEGEWVLHEQHGRQLSVTKAPVIQEWTPEIIAGVLTAHDVDGRVVAQLRAYFGRDLAAALDAHSTDRLLEVPDMTRAVAEYVVSRWKTAKAYFQTLAFLSQAGVPRRQVSQVWAMFGDEAEEILSTNPWALVRIDGITFAQADDVAVRLRLEKNCPARVEGAVRFVCKSKKGMGHLYLTSGEITSEVEFLIGSVKATEVAAAIVSLHKQKQLVVDGKTRPGLKALYEPWLYTVESASARLLRDRQETARVDRDQNVALHYVTALKSAGAGASQAALQDPSDFRKAARASLTDWSSSSQVRLSEKQVEGVVNALSEPVSIVTGLPGTGKSTSLKAVVSILRDAQVNVLLVAPTGIAAKRLTTVTGAPAATIHRAFGAQGWDKGEEREASYLGVTGGPSANLEGSDGSGEMWGCSEVPHAADVVVCDESSMVDQHLLYRILTCTKPTTRLIFIGDAQQLPSVGPGNVLRDMISSELFPVVSLTEIFRQAETSQIVVGAHAISRGEVPPIGEDPMGEFTLIRTPSEEQVLSILVQMATSLYQQKENFQVMSPRHSGTLGVTNLNAKLREPLNPKQSGLQEMRLGSEVIREGDRIMVIRNNYEKEVFNGDVGKIQKLDRRTKEVVVKVHGPPIRYVRFTFREATDYLRLAYCTTIHKMQGQEADTVLIPIVSGFAQQLQRNLLYTALTRARKRAILIGQHDAFVRAIFNCRQDARNTLFLDRLLAVSKPVG